MVKVKLMPYIYHTASRDITVNSYLVSSDSTNVVIDPCDIDAIVETLGTRKLDAVLLTHGHWDHILGIKDCVERFGCKVYASVNAPAKFADPHLNCSDTHNFVYQTHIPQSSLVLLQGDSNFVIGDINVTAQHFGGHCDCSIFYYIQDNCFVGDSLFVHKVVHTEFPTSNATELAINTKNFLDSHRLENLNIYPGHTDPYKLSEII